MPYQRDLMSFSFCYLLSHSCLTHSINITKKSCFFMFSQIQNDFNDNPLRSNCFCIWNINIWWRFVFNFAITMYILKIIYQSLLKRKHVMIGFTWWKIFRLKLLLTLWYVYLCCTLFATFFARFFFFFFANRLNVQLLNCFKTC